PDSPFEDLRNAIELGKVAGRDPGSLYYYAAHVHGTAAGALRKAAFQNFTAGACPVGTAPLGSIVGPLGNFGVCLSMQDEAAFHGQKTAEYARRAIER